MKSNKVLSGCLVGISVLVLSCSNALSGVRQDVDKNTADIADIKAIIGGLPDLEKRVDDLEERVTALENAAKPQMACVTGMFAPGSMDDPIITSQMNISISDPYEVFTIYDESKTGGDSWGLLCNDGWINTGCSSAVDGTSGDLDVSQMNNGCYSDDEEYDKLWLYTNCCKIVGDQP